MPLTPYTLFVLAYTPAWIGVMAFLMVTHAMRGWGEQGYLALGLGLALPLWIGALVVAPGRGPASEREGVRFQVVNAVTVILQSALGTLLFFHRLGMEYRFPVRLTILGTPLFLFGVTVAYFSTYYVVMGLALAALSRAPRAARIAARVALCFGVAFAETWFMATPGMREWFLYRDRPFMLTTGSLCYGTLFLCTLPAYEQLTASPRPSLGRLALGALGANALALACYGLFALVVTPR